MVELKNKPAAKLIRTKKAAYSIDCVFTHTGSIEVIYDYGKEYGTTIIPTADLANFLIVEGYDYSESYDLGAFIFENLYEVTKAYITAKDIHQDIARVRLHI